MKPRLLWMIVMALCVHMGLSAQTATYNAAFDNAPAEQAIRTLKQTTGYDFVYQKDLISKNRATVTGTYTHIGLADLLDATVDQQLGLAYKIVGKTVSLSAPDKTAYAFDHMVTGHVYGEDGEPLPGATVMLKGTRHGTSTDIDGRFSLYVHHTDPVLAVTYVGMNPKDVKLTLRNIDRPINVTLSTNVSTMDEIVVTGYQNIKRENATGSYSIISGEELNKRHNADVTSSLEGNIPGLVKKRNTYGEGEQNIVIRGVGTFQASSAPLVVVDGLPIDGGIETVNNYDIKNITVLKDASAAAIYGARASNGVIVITTKNADRERLTVDFNADISVTGRTDYSKAGFATAAQLVQLEQLNFNHMRDNSPYDLNNVLSSYNNLDQRHSLTPITRLLARNYLGEVTDAELAGTLGEWSRNDYRSEWQDAVERTRVSQLYNLQLRNQGKILASTFTFNYTDDNMGLRKERTQQFQFRYKGDLKAASWLDLSFSANVINRNRRANLLGNNGDMNSFKPYQSMYNADGSLAAMEADALLENPVFGYDEFGLQDHSFNLRNEIGNNRATDAYTNIRAYAHALFHIPVKGWNASLMYQHEDIQSQSQNEYMAQSYHMRDLYNRYTTGGITKVWKPSGVDFYDYYMNPDAYGDDYSYYDPNTFDFFYDDSGNIEIRRLTEETLPVEHHLPYGGILYTNTSRSRNYTFRAQTDFNRTFADKHDVSALVGFEFRQNRYNASTTTLMGYDHQTMNNQNVFVDWSFIQGFGKQGILGNSCPPSGAYANFSESETLHRYYSYYFTGSYVYDSRYSVFGSYRVDKTDLFGTDPKFRGRPLWSVGGSWNVHNETFLRGLTWMDALKLRVSYGLTGNIKSNATSYMVASLDTNRFNGGNYGKITSAPNDQLRWEKTSTWNWGLDFAFLGYRLNGSIDAYRKYGSDLLCDVAVDRTTGWSDLLLNAGEMLNSGFELQLNGRILQARNRNQVGIDLGVTFGYNHNKVTKVYYHPTTGSDFRSMSLKQGYPLGTVTGIDYAGLVEDNGAFKGQWRDHNGELHSTSLSSADFTIDDVVYLGTSTPVWTGGLVPEIRYQGFTLSSMMHFYGGHYMNVDPRVWNTYYSGSGGYSSSTPASALDYWNGVEGTIPNGYQSKYLDYRTGTIGAADYRNYGRADYLKVRSVTLSYDFERKLVRRIGLGDLRLRFQVDNVATWARNGRSWDPETVSSVYPLPVKTPATYTMSLFLNL